MSIFLGFLLPVWALSFAVSSLGGERESRTLVWLTGRPIPRSWQYLAKFLGSLPWVLAFCMAGFAAVCLTAGEPGYLALTKFWPAVLGGAVAFAALFHLIGAVFPRPAVVSLVYAFFIESLASDLLPGTLKRVSVSYYSRCLVYHDALEEGWQLEHPLVLQPLSPETCWGVLIGVTVALTALGMFWFSRTEYQDDV